MRHTYIKKLLHGPANTRNTGESAVDSTGVAVRHEDQQDQVRTDQRRPAQTSGVHPAPISFKLQRLTRMQGQLSIRHAFEFSQSLAGPGSLPSRVTSDPICP